MWKTGSVLVAATVAAFLLAAGPVRAQSCADLQAQLNSVSGGGGGNLAAARKRLASLQRQSSANGCQGSNSMGRPRACAGIDSTLRTVAGPVAALEARGGAGDQNRRKRIQAQMAKQKCGQAAPARQQQARPAEPAPAQVATERGAARPDFVVQNNRIVSTKRTEGGGLLSLLFGGGRGDGARPGAGAAGGGPATLTSLQPGPKTTGRSTERETVDGDGKVTYARHFFGGGSYRTLCVRSCDGYYFPISTVTTRGNFARDDAVCQSLCPQAALYAHSSGSESENMYRVADGRSYKELETAFAYRKTYNPSCSCTFEAKMIVSADGQELIDVEGSRAAYSPAITSDAAAAIDGLATAGGVGAEITAVVAEPAIIEGDAPDLPAVIDASAAGPAAQIKTPVIAEQPATAAVPAAILPEMSPAAGPITDISFGSGEAADQPPLTPAASTATAPRGAPIPPSTPEPLRVRTIGPEFLQSP